MFKKLFDKVNEAFETKEEPATTQNEASLQSDDESFVPDEVSYDPETQHGTHYDVEDFDAAVAELAEDWIKDEEADGEIIDEADRNNIYTQYRKQLYKEWNECDDDQLINFLNANSMKYTGVQTSGFIKVEDGNPFLEPVHGISLKDYAAIAIKISQGFSQADIFKAMGIDSAIWDELNTIWPQRMGEDTSFTVVTLYGQYFAESATNPKLAALKVEASENGDQGAENLERLKTDRYFYEELAGARQAAYEYGLDGAQWILENYGISLGDFQAVAMAHLTEGNKNFNSDKIMHFSNYQEEKQAEYAEKFAAEQGGNVADDVEF